MVRLVVPMLAALVVASPLAAQQPPAVRDSAARDTTKKPAAVPAKPSPKTDSAAGEVARPDSAQPKKDSLAPAAPNTAAPVKPSVQPALITPQRPTFRCKDGTIAYVTDSTKACGLRGGVDSVYAKPKPTLNPNP